MTLLYATALRAQQPLPLAAADGLGAEVYAATSNTGMVLVLVRDKDVFVQTYGETAPGSGQKPTASSLIRLCSLSKILATDLLIKLMLEHKVDFTDALQRYAPAGGHVPTRTVRGPVTRAITIGDLATHTAGLPREVGPAPKGTPHFTFPDHAYRWDWLRRQHLLSNPGEVALYSNVSFDLLGDALETISGQSYAHLFAERTATPLGLKETTLSPTPDECSRLLIGAHHEGACTDTQASGGSGGMYSTAEDMTRVLEYLLGLPGVSVAQNAAAQAMYLDPAQMKSVKGLDHAGDPTGIGLGWLRLGQPGDPGMIIEKTGGGGGFTTYIALNPAHHMGLFLAATEALHSNHVNIFHQANNLLTVMAGLPPLPPDPEPVSAHTQHMRTAHVSPRRSAAAAAKATARSQTPVVHHHPATHRVHAP